MCEAVNFFRQALAEQGLDVDVTHESDGSTDTFYVSKNIAGETITYTTSVSETIQAYSNDDREKQLAIAARSAEQYFDEYLTERLNWNGRHITLRPYDEPEASCGNCGATVKLPSRNRMFAHTAELSAPQPHPVEDETVLESLDDHSRVVLKMYLIGKLREECESYCPNSKASRTESFI